MERIAIALGKSISELYMNCLIYYDELNKANLKINLIYILFPVYFIIQTWIKTIH